MPLFHQQTRETVNTLREQGRTAAFGLRDLVSHIAMHARSMVSVFGVELQEYTWCQAKRAIFLAAAFFLLLCGHLVLCALACTLLGNYIGILWGMAIVCLAHYLAAWILCSLAINRKPGPLAPATRQELKNDLQCLQILLKSEKKNC